MNLVRLSLGQLCPDLPEIAVSYLPNLFQNKIPIQERENLCS